MRPLDGVAIFGRPFRGRGLGRGLRRGGFLLLRFRLGNVFCWRKRGGGGVAVGFISAGRWRGFRVAASVALVAPENKSINQSINK